ncbi:MAG: sensor histidine kinase [Alphaproteobacteria bacterium]
MSAGAEPPTAEQMGRDVLEILTASRNFSLVQVDGHGTITARQGPLLDWLEIGSEAADALPFLVGLEEQGEAAGAGDNAVSYLPNLSIVGATGQELPYFEVYLLRRAEPRGYSIFVQDTTAGSALEQQLMQGRNELRIAQMHLIAAKELAENATQLKDKFVSLVAHDLKTPLASTVQVLELVRTRCAEALDTPLDALMRSEAAGCRRALETIEQLLDVDRLRSGSIEPRMTRVDLCVRAGYAMERCAQAAAAKQITLRNDIPPRAGAVADPDLLDRVMANVVDNAVKFCGAGDTVRLSIEPGEATGLAIEDTGVGIAASRLASLFDLSANRSTAGTGNERGTGLGLPLARELMQALGGEIEIESRPGAGTTVRLRFGDGDRPSRAEPFSPGAPA